MVKLIRINNKQYKRMSKKNIVYFGYPAIPEYKELANLTLTYDKIYDSNNVLTPLLSISPYLAEMLDNLNNIDKNNSKLIEILGNENELGSGSLGNYSKIFLFISSIVQYNGLHPRDWWTIPRNNERFLNNRILSIDNLLKVNEKNSKKFIDIIIPSLKRAYKRNPEAIKKTADVLHEFPLLKKEIIPNDKYWKDEVKIKTKYKDFVFKAIDLDEHDPKFCSLVSEKFTYYDPKSKTEVYDPKWQSLLINDQIIVSSNLEMPLFLDDSYSI